MLSNLVKRHDLAALVGRVRSRAAGSTARGNGAEHVDGMLLEDRFEDDAAPGSVIGSTSTSGARRLGADRFATVSVDHGQLRIGWMQYPGWGRAAIAYGPFAAPGPLVVTVRALNGLTTSQSDWRPEGGRAMLRRWRATLPRAPLRRPRVRDNMVIGCFRDPVQRAGPTPVAAVIHRAGGHQAGELWFQVGASRIRLCDELQNLPATYSIVLRKGLAELYAWSYSGATGFAEPGDTEPLASITLGALPDRVFVGVHQPILGEVFYRVDTRVDLVQVSAPGDDVQAAILESARHEWWDPDQGPPVVADGLDGDHSDLAGSCTATGRRRWSRVLGDGVLDRSDGGARVRATRAEPNPGRTVYCVPWSEARGAIVTTAVTPPGTRRGEHHRGRGGVAFWQDPDNHLVVNTYLDDAMTGVSVSAFLRTSGEETMYEWDAVWTNVASRIRHGQPYQLSVACDGRQFLCKVDGEPVLYRALTDYRVDAQPLDITGVGLVANWEWGDDTGTTFAGFDVREITS